MSEDSVRITVVGDPDLVMELPLGQDPAGLDSRLVVRPLPLEPHAGAAGEVRYEVTVDGWVFEVRAEPAARAALRERARRGATATKQHVREQVRARIPGRVVRVWVSPGQTVGAGERLLAIEAMKMENEVRAPRAGTVASIKVEVGQPVELGAELLSLG